MGRKGFLIELSFACLPLIRGLVCTRKRVNIPSCDICGQDVTRTFPELHMAYSYPEFG